MSSAPHPSGPAVPLHRFKPTNGVLVGWMGLAAIVVIDVYLLLRYPSWESLSISLALALAGVVIWMTMLRPRATVFGDRVVLHNVLTDTHVPLARVDAVVVRHTLNVWVGDERYVCIGIGQSSRSLMKRRSRGPMAALGLEQTDDRMGQGQSATIGDGAAYHTFVEVQLTDLAKAARRDHVGAELPVLRTWARPELITIAALGVGLVLSLTLR